MSWEEDLVRALEETIVEDVKKSGPYTTDFYKNHEKYKTIYHFIADMIVGNFRPQSVIDLGCGCGFLLERMHEQGVTTIFGLEQSQEAQVCWTDEMKKYLHLGDILRYDFSEIQQADLVVCMEVGEHISPHKSESLVTKVTQLAKYLVWWTAAQPGQAGDGHINTNSLCYWERQFNARSFVANWEVTYQLKQEMLRNQMLCLGFPWFRDNLVVYQRVGRSKSMHSRRVRS